MQNNPNLSNPLWKNEHFTKIYFAVPGLLTKNHYTGRYKRWTQGHWFTLNMCIMKWLWDVQYPCFIDNKQYNQTNSMHQLEIKKVSYLVLFSQIYNSEMYALLLNRLISNQRRFVSFQSAIKTLMLPVIKKNWGTLLFYMMKDIRLNINKITEKV